MRPEATVATGGKVAFELPRDPPPHREALDVGGEPLAVDGQEPPVLQTVMPLAEDPPVIAVGDQLIEYRHAEPISAAAGSLPLLAEPRLLQHVVGLKLTRAPAEERERAEVRIAGEDRGAVALLRGHGAILSTAGSS